MDYTTLSLASAPEGKDLLSEDRPLLTSLYSALQALPDVRRGQGKRYELALLICLLLLAKLAGQTSLSAATQWVRHRGEQIAACFGLHRASMPCQMTYCRMLASLDGKELDDVLAAFFIRLEAQQRCANEPSRLGTTQGAREHEQLAIDGKTVRATSRQAHRVHLLSCYDVTTGTVLWHWNVEEKQNEGSRLKPLMTPTLITGRIFTLDAMHTRAQNSVPRFIGGKAAIYSLPKTTNRHYMKILLTYLRTAPLIVGLGWRRRPGRKDMDAWNIAKSSVVPISMTGSAKTGKASLKSFVCNARPVCSKRAPYGSRRSMDSAICL